MSWNVGEAIEADDDDGIRLDRWFRRHYPAVTHGLLEKLLRKGEVRLDGKRAEVRRRVTGRTSRAPAAASDPRQGRTSAKAETVRTSRWARWRTGFSTWTSR